MGKAYKFASDASRGRTGGTFSLFQLVRRILRPSAAKNNTKEININGESPKARSSRKYGLSHTQKKSHRVEVASRSHETHPSQAGRGGAMTARARDVWFRDRLTEQTRVPVSSMFEGAGLDAALPFGTSLFHDPRAASKLRLGAAKSW